MAKGRKSRAAEQAAYPEVVSTAGPSDGALRALVAALARAAERDAWTVATARLAESVVESTGDDAAHD